jgi:nucleotide-binding universal stress UspA family protein
VSDFLNPKVLLPFIVGLILLTVLIGVTVAMIRRRLNGASSQLLDIFIVLAWVVVILAVVNPDALKKPDVKLTVEEQQAAQARAVAEEAKRKQEQAEYTELAFAKATIQSGMRDPGSTVFGANTTAYSDRKYKGQPAVVVCGSVNAKNGLGGYSGFRNFVFIRSSNIFAIDNDDDNSTFVRLWKSLCFGKHS